MKSDSQFNTAVLVLGYNRPDSLHERLQELVAMEAKNVFISVDGPKPCDPFLEDILAAQEIASSFQSKFQFKCTTHSENLGLSRHVTETITQILQSFEWVIVIEDDIKLSPNSLNSFFTGIRIMEEGSLNGTVGGFSFYGTRGNSKIDNLNFWRTSRYFSAWGWAINRISWNKYALDLSDHDLEANLKNSEAWGSLNKRQQAAWISKFNKVKVNPSFTWDFQMVYAGFVNDWKHLLPVFRFVDNVGFGDSRGTHTKGERPANLIGAANSGNLRNVLLTGNLFNRIFSWLDSSTWILDDPLTIRTLLRLGKIRRLFTKK